MIRILLLCSLPISGFGQDFTAQDLEKLKPKGVFMKDSLALGERITYALSIRHSTDVQVLFPDSTYDFKNLQFLKKTYFPTLTDAQSSLDSAVYEFTIFDIAPYFTLQMPIYILDQGDSLLINTELDSVFLREVVSAEIDTLDFKTDTKETPLPIYFNYPYLVMGVFIFFVVILGIWGLLGKQIRKVYSLFQFRARHQIFLNDFSRLLTRIKNRENIADIEKIISIWKKHLEFLVEKPFSSYTSKEISRAIPDQSLASSLKNIDRALYGKEFSEELGNSLNKLRQIAVQQFEKRRIILRER
jgi:hypothetical protein